MIINLSNPDSFVLIHKKSGIKFNTSGATFISYNDEKFIKEGVQEPLFNKFKI